MAPSTEGDHIMSTTRTSTKTAPAHQIANDIDDRITGLADTAGLFASIFLMTGQALDHADDSEYANMVTGEFWDGMRHMAQQHGEAVEALREQVDLLWKLVQKDGAQ
jgi:hypothetical protein